MAGEPVVRSQGEPVKLLLSMVGATALLASLSMTTGCGSDVRCVRAIACVETCGGPVVHEGCECPSETVPQETCAADGGQNP